MFKLVGASVKTALALKPLVANANYCEIVIAPPYTALPWFWSEQGALRLQMAGLIPQPPDHAAPTEAAEQTTRHRRPGATPASFSVLHYVGEKLVCVESVNAPLDHLAARKLLEAGKSPAPAQACAPVTPLKNLL